MLSSYPAVSIANSLLAPSPASSVAFSVSAATNPLFIPPAFLLLFLPRKQHKHLQPRNQPPRLLSQDVPACALACLEGFISTARAWDRCPKPHDVNCLCKQRSNSGFTVAEAGLRCVAENCPASDEAQHRIYNICSGVQGALPNTHPVLEISSTPDSKPKPTMASTTINVPGSSPAPTSQAPLPPAPEPTVPTTSQAITSLPSSTTTRGIPGVGVPTDSIEFSYAYTSPSGTSGPRTSLPSSATTSTASPAPTGEASGGGRSNQLIGLYVGGSIALVALFAFVGLFFFLKKRKQRAMQAQVQAQIDEKGPGGPYIRITRSRTASRTPTAPGASYASSRTRSVTPCATRALPPIDMMQCSDAYLHRNTRDLENEYLSSGAPSVVSHRTESDLLPENPYCIGNCGATRDRSPGARYSSGTPGKILFQQRESPQPLIDSPAMSRANRHGYPSHSPNLNYQPKFSPDPNYLAIPSKSHPAFGRGLGSVNGSRERLSALNSPYSVPEPLSSRSICSFQSHIPRQLSPVKEVPSTGPPSSAGSSEFPHNSPYVPQRISYLTESDDVSEVSIRTFSKLVPQPLTTQRHHPLSGQCADPLPDHSPTLPRSIRASMCSYSTYSRRNSDDFTIPLPSRPSSAHSVPKPSSLLIKRRGEKVADKLSIDSTIPAKLQHPIHIEHDRIPDGNVSPISIAGSSCYQFSHSVGDSVDPPSPLLKHIMTPSKRGGDMYLNIT